MIATPAAARRRGIITPEAVVLEFETAGVASRMLARLVDGLALWGILMAVSIVVGLIGPALGEVGAVVFVLGVVFMVVFGYWTLMEAFWRGRTLGKAALGLRVVTVEGAPIRFRHAAIRSIVGVVDFLLPPLGPVAIVSVLSSARDQRLGDLAAGTIVLRERQASGDSRVVTLVEPLGHPDLMASLALAPVDDAAYGVIRRFLIRAPTLDPATRAHLADLLCSRVARVVGVAPPVGMHPEWFLHAVGLAHQRRLDSSESERTRSAPAPAPAPALAPPPPRGSSAVALPPPPPPRPPVAPSRHPGRSDTPG